MDKKMTSGEIAKKAGISQKAVRLYDEKGLLKPTEYSEGNYRLYDKEALLVLEKIIALKHIGYSLEEIHGNLITEKSMDITESLNSQLELMEAKKHEIERTISCIKSVLTRTNGNPDWNSVAEIARMIQHDQRADESHFNALKHTAEKMDWYEKIYNSLDIKKDSNILDLGCGFGKLWRNNWDNIPTGVRVKGVDLHGSWADDFEGFIKENKSELAEGTDIDILWSDVEDEATWNEIEKYEPYQYIIAHYLLSFLRDKEIFVQRASSVLKEGGLFSCNGYYVSKEDSIWQQMFEDMKLNASFATEKTADDRKQQNEFKAMLEKYFGKIEVVNLTSNMRYTECGELVERLYRRYPEKKKYFANHEDKIKSYFSEKILEDGEIIIQTDSAFWHCYK